MIEVIDGAAPRKSELLDRAFRLRHQVFVEELGWESLRRSDGFEIDQFDDQDATHFLATEGRDVVGYFRSRPTAKPHLLSDVHHHLCNRRYPRSFAIVEWTRYCVTPARREGGAFAGVGSELIVAGMEWSLRRGIRDVVLEYHPAWIARFMGLGFKVEPLGLPDEIEGDPVIAVHMNFDDAVLERTRVVRGSFTPVLAAEFDPREKGQSVA